MKKTKKGFTLVELLVTIACSTIVLLSLVSSFYFINVLSNKVLSDSSINYNLANLKETIIIKELFDEEKYTINESNKTLLYEGEVIANGVLFSGVYFTDELANNDEENTFLYCTIHYFNASNKISSFKFIVK